MIVDVGVPVLVMIAMFVVGMELTTDDFRRVARQPGIVVAATLGQFVALPAIAWLLVRCLPLQPSIAQGLLLVAACPSGTMANVYSHLARANIALSVTLTAVSCMAALVTTPLAMAVLQMGAEETERLTLPLRVLSGQLVVLLILPVLGGMGLRRCWPDLTKRHGRALLGVSVASLALLLTAIVMQESQRFVSAFPEIATAASLLTALAFAGGWVTGWAGGANRTDRFTVGMVFVVRNVGIATAIAVTVLGRSEFAVFATSYFLAQVPLLLVAAYRFRRSQVDAVSHVVKVEPL